MNFEQYFRDRGELVRAVLGETADDHPVAVGWRSFAAGLGIVVAAGALQQWAAGTQSDPGYFARTTTFMVVALGGGVWLLTAALLADYRLSRFALSARAALKERTVRQMLRIDGLLARTLTGERNKSHD